MNNEEYFQHWNYFCSLALRLDETKNYVFHGLSDEGDRVQFVHGNVYSDVFKQIIVLAASEFEIIAKALCIEHGKKPRNIVGISKTLLKVYPRIVDTEISTAYWIGTPLQDWAINDDNKIIGLDWWIAYNSLKHNEVNSYKDATLENAVLALAALYTVNLYLMYKLFDNLAIAYTYPCVYYRSKYTGSFVNSGEGLLPDFGNKSATEILHDKYPDFFEKKKKQS